MLQKQLFVHCQIVQKAKKYLEDIDSNTVQVTLDEFNSLQCFYPVHLNKSQTTLIYTFSIVYHNAIGSIGMKLYFLIKMLMKIQLQLYADAKLWNFTQVKRYQVE